ncbi:DUF6174 domain-containing protein [Paractinoplanes globisporus]|uniref:DUF6174 domain-containing protein n=1 Tax=Paractinoplanes globisporus TaxID=113565 RepID=A0ABW6WG28_9ACTN|nr:DUF6174 domain-containing protein [Actinoplanes globisporus]
MAFVGGCTSHSDSPTWNGSASSAPATAAPVTAESAPPFTEPASYTYTLTHGCNDASPQGKYKVTVQSGAVTGAQRIGGAAPSASASSDVDLGPIEGQEGEEIDVPTLAELRDMAQTATDDGGQVTTTYDGKDGHPVKVVINVTDDSTGAECWTVADYAPAS